MGSKDTRAEITLHIFSGRPDPEWSLSEDEIEELKTKLNNLPASKSQEDLSGLGYRGISITSRGKASELPERIFVFKGSLSVTNKGKTTVKKDVNDIEGWILNKAREQGYEEFI